MLTRIAAGLVVALLAAANAFGATITVTSTADTIAVDGGVTLREAIASINGGADINADVVAVGAYGTNDTIVFSIGSGVQTIVISNLPTVTKPITIDGTTQPGFAGTPLIVLDGQNTINFSRGLDLNSSSTVRGLVIGRFFFGIALNGGASSVIAGNYIGIAADGVTSMGSTGAGAGILVLGATNTLIGGTTLADRNVISGNNVGIQVATGTGTTIQGNFVGTNAAGTAAVPNKSTSIDVTGASTTIGGVTGTTPGGPCTGACNLISGNLEGPLFEIGSTNGVVLGNMIGTNAAGTAGIPNTQFGLLLADSNIVVGSPGAGSNTIAFNGEVGVRVDQGTGNPISGNRIFSNTLLGIDLAADGKTPNDAGDADTGPNNLQNFPVITSAVVSAGNATISGTLNSTPNSTFRLEFFANTVCDSSGNGEGESFIGFTNVSTDGSGNATFGPLVFPATLPVITATATDNTTHDTSEFSACPSAPPPTPSLSINNVSASEGNSGTTPFVFTVTLSAASASTVTVNFATANGTATAGSDYTAVSGTLTFNPGVTTQTITVNVNGDTTVEPDETFTVTLSAPTNATIASGTGTGTIVNDDAPATPSLSINSVTANEGNSGTTPFVFTVTLSAASASTVTVNFATADGSATAGSDYAATSGTLTFAPGVTTQTITVNVTGDTTVEPNETFFVNLGGATNATIAVAQGVGTINNDDLSVPPANVVIPTLSGWGLVLLALMLAGAAGFAGRRRGG